MKPRTLAGAVLAASLALAAPAAAAGPVKSPHADYDVFTCPGGVRFEVVTIAQNQAPAVQVLEGASGVFHLTRIVAPDGTVVFDVPGQRDKTDVTGCTSADFPGYTGEGFFSPR